MKLYRKYIRPMRGYPGQYYEPKTEPIEKEEKWYPEEEREYLENKYSYLNKRSFSDLIFEEKYEPYDALELLTHNAPQIVRCKDCEYSNQVCKKLVMDRKFYFCTKHKFYKIDNWYCADGEQKK